MTLVVETLQPFLPAQAGPCGTGCRSPVAPWVSGASAHTCGLCAVWGTVCLAPQSPPHPCAHSVGAVPERREAERIPAPPGGSCKPCDGWGGEA